MIPFGRESLHRIRNSELIFPLEADSFCGFREVIAELLDAAKNISQFSSQLA